MSGSPWGGSEELWSQAALRLQTEGHQVAASVKWWPQFSPKVTALAERGVKIYPRNPPVRLSLGFRVLRKIQNRLWQTPDEFDWLQQQKPDLVVISQGMNTDGLRWMTFCCNAGLPFVSIVQCNQEQWWPEDSSHVKIVAAYRAARKVFCVSRHNMKLLEWQLGEPLPNAKVVCNPFNVPADQPSSWPEHNGVWKAACVARMDPGAKGQDLLLEVLSQSRWRERPLEVNFYGTGPSEQSLKKLAGHLGVKNVSFRGHVFDVRRIWEDSHILVMPSRYEGLPLALVEAMWCGRPAVVTDVGGNTELCVDGETGFVVAAPTVGLLDLTLERAWSHRDQWQLMGISARRHVEQVIPKDPATEFSQQLLQCVEGQTTESRNCPGNE